MKITKTLVSREEAHSVNGIGNWGVKFAHDDEAIAWECPSVGDGGADTRQNLEYSLGWLMASFVTTTPDDWAEGPNDILIRGQNGEFYLLEVSAGE